MMSAMFWNCHGAIVAVVVVLMVSAAAAAEPEFDPYRMNGGLVSAVAGKDFVVVATDTRLSEQYQILGRHHVSSRIWTTPGPSFVSSNTRAGTTAPDGSLIVLSRDLDHSNESDTMVELTLQNTLQHTNNDGATVWIASAGCQADCEGLKRTFGSKWRAAVGGATTTAISPAATALALHHTLYSRRGFPYYAFCLVAGLSTTNSPTSATTTTDPKVGSVYAYDAIGSYEQVAVASAGTGRDFLQPILDRLFSCDPTSSSTLNGNVDHGDAKQVTCDSPDQVVELLVQAYRAVAEREIAVGDGLVLVSTQWRDGKCETRVWSSPLKRH
jgi:20S proteasome subunit beta 6